MYPRIHQPNQLRHHYFSVTTSTNHFTSAVGAQLSAPGAVTDIRLLPGRYTTTTNPELLHSLLTNKDATMKSSSQGFTNNGTVSLPLDVALQPGIAVYSQSMYSGNELFAPLPTSRAGNSSTPITSQSLALSSNVLLSIQSGSDRVVFWSSVPDVAQLPVSVATGALAILDIQSTSCTPTCSGNGVCSVSGTCSCPTGFTGPACESCSDGFFGPKCQPCPSNCDKCDQGITGTGACLTPAVANLPSTCNCVNGVCGSNGQCTCNPGWTTGANGTSCSACSKGFFKTNGGDCQGWSPPLAPKFPPANAHSQFVNLVVPSVLREQGLALPANPVLPRTPTTDRNASPRSPPRRPELHAPTEVSVAVPLVTVALRRVKRVLDRHRTIVLSVVLAHTSSTGAALALMEMAFAPVLV